MKAFPYIEEIERHRKNAGFSETHTEKKHHSGMYLRDYFASKAMQGCLAYSAVNPSNGNWQENSTPESLAEYSYKIADTMLKAREL